MSNEKKKERKSFNSRRSLGNEGGVQKEIPNMYDIQIGPFLRQVENAYEQTMKKMIEDAYNIFTEKALFKSGEKFKKREHNEMTDVRLEGCMDRIDKWFDIAIFQTSAARRGEQIKKSRQERLERKAKNIADHANQIAERLKILGLQDAKTDLHSQLQGCIVKLKANPQIDFIRQRSNVTIKSFQNHMKEIDDYYVKLNNKLTHILNQFQ